MNLHRGAYRRPLWLPRHEWEKVMTAGRHYCPVTHAFKCANCEEVVLPGNIHWDHIIARSRWNVEDGETPHVSSNVQPLCPRCNLQKGDLPDRYWSSELYFDQSLHLHNLRSAQLDFVYNRIVIDYGHVFSQPFCVLSNWLYSFFQIVGAGKTLGAFCIPFALNSLRELGSPRVSRILVMAINKELRSQIARELREEPEKYKLVEHAPRVKEIKNGDDVRDTAACESYDIGVVCAQLLWEKANNPEGARNLNVEQVERFLAKHECIIVDEAHFASKHKVGYLVKCGPTSVWFGFTATPIDDDGQFTGLDYVARASVYDYSSAIRNDDSMKGFGTTSYDHIRIDALEMATTRSREHAQERHNVRDVLATMYADVIQVCERREYQDHRGEWSRFGDPTGQLPQVLSVTDEVVDELKHLDNMRTSLDGRTIANHRRGHLRAEHEAGEGYWAHAIIRVENINQANAVVHYLNEKFDNDRSLYPKKLGYTASTAHSEGVPLDEDHPWLRCQSKANNGEIDSQCSRLLVVVALATEGTNNRYCNVLGIAHRLKSLRKLAQSVGRLVRSTHTKTVLPSGAIMHTVPPLHFDQIKLILHRDFHAGDEWRVPWALQFLEYINHYTRQFRDIDHVFNELFDQDWDEQDIDRRVNFAYWDKVQIIEKTQRRLFDWESRQECITPKFIRQMQKQYGGDNVDRNDRIEQLIREAVSASDGNVRSKKTLRKELRLRSIVDPERIIANERLSFENVSTEYRIERVGALIGTQGLALVEESKLEEFATTVYEHHKENVHAQQFESTLTIKDVLGSLSAELHSGVRPVARITTELAEVLVRTAVDMLLDTTQCWEQSYSATVLHELNSSSELKAKVFGYAVMQLAMELQLYGIYAGTLDNEG